MMDRPPSTLNPRMALDGTGQRIGALMFRGLTTFDPDLRTIPDLAKSWTASPDGRRWEFSLDPEARDHEGQPITAERMAACLEGYRAGAPSSPLRGSFPSWKRTRASGEKVILELDRPDPYLAANISLLRYFRVAGKPEPCADPKGEDALIGSGAYRARKWDSSPDTEITLDRVGATPGVPGGAGARSLSIFFIQDENTKALKLLRGDADASLNTLRMEKVRWLQREYPDRFRVMERDGIAVQYLAFNTRDPLLKDPRVRRAITLAIDREHIVRHRFTGYCTVAGSFLSPMLPEAHSVAFEFDPAKAERLLDEAGFPRAGDGARMRLRYKTTSVREGYEMALMFREMLARIGIELELEVVEPAVFFASVRKGHYQLHSSRWLGLKDSSIYYSFLRSGSPNPRTAAKPQGKLDNRTGYANPEMDALLDQLVAEADPARRAALSREVQALASRDVPFFPLWFWNNALILRKDLRGLEARDLSLAGSLEPLARLGWE